MLATRQGAGVFVTATDVTEDLQTVIRRADIISVLDARTAVEAEAAALAAERYTDADLSAMRVALAERDRHRTDPYELVDADMSFHRGIVLGAHSPILLELFDGFAPRSRDAMVEMLRRRGSHGEDSDQQVHLHIVEAIVAGDAEKAAGLTREHLIALKRLSV